MEIEQELFKNEASNLEMPLIMFHSKFISFTDRMHTSTLNYIKFWKTFSKDVPDFMKIIRDGNDLSSEKFQIDQLYLDLTKAQHNCYKIYVYYAMYLNEIVQDNEAATHIFKE